MVSCSISNLGKKNVTSVLIEGGGDILGQALDEHLIDKLQCYIAPNLTGGPVMAFAGRGGWSTPPVLTSQEDRHS